MINSKETEKDNNIIICYRTSEIIMLYTRLVIMCEQ